MAATLEQLPDEIRHLKACISDLVGVLGFRAIWSGSEPARIVSMLVDILAGTLHLDFAYARHDDPMGAAPVSAVRIDAVLERRAWFAEALEGLMVDLPPAGCVRRPHPVGGGDMGILCVRLGLQEDMGVLIVGSSRPEFPLQTDRLLVSVAANQAAIGLHEGRRLTQRATELVAANKELSREIGERRRAEEALRVSEMYLTEAQRLSHTGSFGWNPDSGAIHWTDETYEVMGLPRSTRPTLHHVLRRVHPEDLAQYQEAFSRSLRRGQPLDFESRLLMDDGSVRYVQIRARPLRQASGNVEFVGAVTDVTFRREAEAERLKLEARLVRAEKMEAIGTLAGGIAHDFNNLLGAIIGYAELAQGKAREGSAIAEDLDKVMQAGQRGKRLVEKILAFSRSGTGRRTPVHVESVIDEALAFLAASLPHGVRLEHRLCAGDAAVLGDATQLHQVAMNLSTNAVQAMPDGGLLSVALDRVDLAEQRVLSHGTLERGCYVRLSVSDTGSGIAKEALGRIFDPFFTTKSVRMGTGLGLSLVHGIVAESRGAIDVVTSEGAGSTFIVWLPCSGETALPAKEQDAAPRRGHGEAVMVVDDEDVLVQVAEETLARLGYEPVGFDSSVAALEAFRVDPQRYALVLTDETMPGLTGTELACKIRELSPDIPVLLMSGYRGPQLTAQAQAAGVREILHKPLLRGDIADALARALSGAS